MDFWEKPRKIEHINYKREPNIEIPEDILHDGEYMIFHTKETLSIGHARAVYWVLLSSKGRLFSCEYGSKKFEVLDHIAIYKNRTGTGIDYFHDIQEAFICNGWLLILKALDDSGYLVISRTWQEGGSFFDPLIILLKLYIQLFPETIISDTNNNHVLFFKMKTQPPVTVLADTPRDPDVVLATAITQDLSASMKKSNKKSKKKSNKKSKKRSKKY